MKPLTKVIIVVDGKELIHTFGNRRTKQAVYVWATEIGLRGKIKQVLNALPE